MPRQHTSCSGEILSNERSQGERKTCSENDECIKDIIHKRCGRKLICAMLADHYGIRKSRYDAAKLIDYDRQGKFEKK